MTDAVQNENAQEASSPEITEKVVSRHSAPVSYTHLTLPTIYSV